MVRKAEPTERWISINLVTERWFIASRGLAMNLTNPLRKKPSKILVMVDPVEVIPVDDVDALAEALECRIDRKPLALPPIT